MYSCVQSRDVIGRRCRGVCARSTTTAGIERNGPRSHRARSRAARGNVGREATAQFAISGGGRTTALSGDFGRRPEQATYPSRATESYGSMVGSSESTDTSWSSILVERCYPTSRSTTETATSSTTPLRILSFGPRATLTGSGSRTSSRGHGRSSLATRNGSY